MTRQKRVAQRQQYKGIVCGPYNMLKDYTADDMAKMREAGRQYALEREVAIMETVLGVATHVEPKPVESGNRKTRRKLAAQKRKAKKMFDKIKKQVVGNESKRG